MSTIPIIKQSTQCIKSSKSKIEATKYQQHSFDMPCKGPIILEETPTTKYLIHLQNHVMCLFNSVREFGRTKKISAKEQTASSI